MAIRDDYPGAEPFLPRRKSLKALREAVQNCRGCDLYQGATQAVPGDGVRHPELVVVGEQPGDIEDQRGEPFVGPAGRMLDRALEAASIDPSSVYRTNAVKHFCFRGRQGKRRIHAKPDEWQVRACSPWLGAELAILKPHGIVVLGATAGRAILGPSFRVKAMRGQVVPAPEAPSAPWIVASTHPSAVLRSPNRKRDFETLVSDLRVAADELHRRSG